MAAVSRDERDIGYPPAHHFLRDLGAVTEQQVAAMHGVGPVAIARLREAMADAGLSWAT